jgi:hypothetical protein
MSPTASSSPERPVPCPSCGTPATGRFCTECGAVVRESRCGNCGGSLTPGAKFCHDCGAPVGVQRRPAATTTRAAGTAPAKPGNNLPWIAGGFAFLTLVVIFAAQRAGQTTPAVAPAGPMGGAGAVDIASMTPQERASRLFDRIMRLSEEGKRDSVALFASMAIPVYESLGPLDADARYDFGRVAQVSGNLDIAQAQADSILQQAPTHLLGLILAAAVADARGDQARRATLDRQLLAAESTERARELEEYTRHKTEIDAAIAAARSRQ